jgi:hypothetical protein
MEARAKEIDHVLLFVVDGVTRAIASMLEATEYILRSRQVCVCVRVRVRVRVRVCRGMCMGGGREESLRVRLWLTD